MAAYDFEKLRIMVVDDNRFMVTIIRSLLETMGIKNVCGVAKGANLFVMMKEWQPDIMIVDQVMTPKTGLDLIREIRETVPDRQRFIPIILMTAYAKQEIVMKARFWAGADAVLVKPMSARRLFNCIVALYESDRTFVNTRDYFGPDRRVKDRPFEGPNRRGGDEEDEIEAVPAEIPGETEDGDFLFLGEDDEEETGTAQRASA